MSTPFFSIVIPVYNGLTHDLPVCLNSIWDQSLDKELYEVICVDDCSTDGTRQWLKEQRQEHSNLQVIENQENIRQGGSRNRGVKAAKGKYIIFIDQDDYYHKEGITAAYNHLQENNLEILIVDCAYQSPGKVSNELQHNFPHREIMSGDEIIEKNSIPYAPWKFIFLRSHMIDNNLFFAENKRIEDIDWVHKLVHYAQRVQYQPILFIHYNKTSISTTMVAYKSKEVIYAGLNMAARIMDLTENCFANSNYNVKTYISNLAIHHYYLNLRNYFSFYDSTQRKANMIEQYIKTNGNKSNSIVIFAQKFPKLFSITSNILSPIGRFALYLYRSYKYKKQN